MQHTLEGEDSFPDILFDKKFKDKFVSVEGRVFARGKDYIFELPRFVHVYSARNHFFKGSLSRHLAIESVLLTFRVWIIHCRVVDAFLSLLFGLNCNFPSRDVVEFFIWQLRGFQPLNLLMLFDGDWKILAVDIARVWTQINEYERSRIGRVWFHV